MGLDGWNFFGGCLMTLIFIVFVSISVVIIYPLPFLLIGGFLYFMAKK
jgi:hypothetical protein